MSNCRLEIVTKRPELWKDSDPVRPELGVSYKTYSGREVYGLRNPAGGYDAFCCVARTFSVPQDIMSLSNLTSLDGSVWVPYTVWSNRPGAGREIIKKILEYSQTVSPRVDRIVTLSPNNDMARKFHLRNGATEIATFASTANFEYTIK